MAIPHTLWSLGWAARTWWVWIWAPECLRFWSQPPTKLLGSILMPDVGLFHLCFCLIFDGQHLQEDIADHQVPVEKLEKAAHSLLEIQKAPMPDHRGIREATGNSRKQGRRSSVAEHMPCMQEGPGRLSAMTAWMGPSFPEVVCLWTLLPSWFACVAAKSIWLTTVSYRMLPLLGLCSYVCWPACPFNRTSGGKCWKIPKNCQSEQVMLDCFWTVDLT